MFSKHYIINFIINQKSIVMKKFSLFLSAMLISMMSFAADYVKVTSAPTDWSGEYLLVYDGEESSQVWTGVDKASGCVAATPADNKISGEDFVTITIAPMTDGYSILVNGGDNAGKFIGGTSGSNKLNFNDAEVLNTIAYDAENAGVLITSNTSVMRFNKASDQMRFRYFKESTYTGQQIVQLYKKAAAVEEPAEKPVVTAAELEQITGEEEIFHFYLSQGVAVDKNPESPYYGYTYVTAATDGADDGGSDRADTQKRGIFVFDAELNSLNPDNVGFLPANAAPLMTDVSRQAMHRLAVNPVNNHVVFCYNVEGASAIWSMDPANLTGDAVNLIEGLAITKANAFCFDAEGTLYVMDNANTADGGKIVKVVNGELVTIAQNAIWGVQDISLASDGRGGLWVAQHRWNIDTYAVLSHVNAAGEVDFAVTKDSPEEVKALFPQDANASYRGQCAYNVEKDVLAFGGNKVVALFHVTYDAAGVPSIAKIGATPAIGNNIDGVDFYANGDLAVVSASAERFQKYAVTYTVEGGEEIEWIEMPLEISNLTTMEMPVEGVTYLQLTGRDDMNDADVMLFLNNYTGEEKAYEVNVESSFMTFGGLELTVMDGSITKSVDPELGDVYAGIVHASVEEEGVAMYVAFDLKMYALPAIEIAIEDVEITVNEESAIATFAATWEGSPLSVEVSGFEEVEFKEYPECWLSIGDDNVWVDAAAGPAAIIIEDGVASLEGEFTSFATGKTYEVMLTGTLPVKEESALKGVVKRAVQLGESVVVLTHEADGTAHIYNVVGENISEVSQEGVVPVDPENKGSYLAISDIALTEDGKLVANNYVRCQFAGTAPEDGYKLGTSYYYIWDDLTGAPRVWFTSQATARSSHGDMGKTFAVKGTSTDAKVLVTAVHNNNRAVRMALYSIIDGVYEEPDIAGGTYNNDYYFNFGLHTTANYYKEATQGKEFYLLASPLADASWIIEGELSEPSEFLVPAEVGADYAANQEIAAGTLGNKYQGTSIVTVGEQVLMVAPYATAEGLLAGVKVLDITAGLAAATEVKALDLDAPVEATAAATAVKVVDGELVVTLVADATIYTLGGKQDIEYMTWEDEITNLVIDYENMAIIGGPSKMWQVEVYLGLGQDNGDGTITLTEESSVSIMGLDARFIDGYVYDIDANAPAVKAVLHVEDSGFFYEFKLNMTSAAPADPIVVVVEDATVTIDTIPLFGDQVDYALNMTADWTNAEDGVTYPVLVEVPVYYPEATEPSEVMSTVTIGGWGENDPWLGFAEGTLTITTVDGVVTAKGIVANPNIGVAFDVTVSGKLPQGPGTGLDNININAKPVKMIKNGMLIINKGGREFNAQGATLK